MKHTRPAPSMLCSAHPEGQGPCHCPATVPGVRAEVWPAQGAQVPLAAVGWPRTPAWQGRDTLTSGKVGAGRAAGPLGGCGKVQTREETGAPKGDHDRKGPRDRDRASGRTCPPKTEARETQARTRSSRAGSPRHTGEAREQQRSQGRKGCAGTWAPPPLGTPQRQARLRLPCAGPHATHRLCLPSD